MPCDAKLSEYCLCSHNNITTFIKNIPDQIVITKTWSFTSNFFYRSLGQNRDVAQNAPPPLPSTKKTFPQYEHWAGQFANWTQYIGHQYCKSNLMLPVLSNGFNNFLNVIRYMGLKNTIEWLSLSNYVDIYACLAEGSRSCQYRWSRRSAGSRAQAKSHYW